MTRRSPPHNRRVASQNRVVMTTQEWQEQGRYWLSLILVYLVFMISVLLSWISIPKLELTPFWVLIPLFTWSIARPELLSGFLILIVGILSDIVIGTPLGIHAMGLLSVQVLVRLQQRFLLTQNFFMIWGNFAMLSFLFTVVTTFLSVLSVDYGDALSSIILSSLYAWGLLVIVFPPLSSLAHLLIGLTRHGK